MLPAQVNDSDLTDGENRQKIVVDTTLGGNGIVAPAKNGTVTKLADNKGYSYTPNIAFNDFSTLYQDSITYQILDSVNYDAVNKYRKIAKIYIKLDAASKGKPSAAEDEASVVEGGTIDSLNILKNDNASADGSPSAPLHHIVIVDGAKFGTVNLKGDSAITYTHNHTENFEDFFTYRAVNTGDEASNIQKVLLHISPVNDSIQVIAPDSAQVNEKSAVTFDVITEKDTDGDKYPLEMTNIILTGNCKTRTPSFGTVSVSDTKKGITYTVDPVKTGALKTGEIIKDTFDLETSDSVKYDITVDDTTAHFIANRVVVTITGLNDNAPTGVSNLQMYVDEGKDFTVEAGKTDTLDLTGLISDIDGDNLTVTVGANAASAAANTGTASVIPGTLKIAYLHNGEEVFTDNFTYTVSDGEPTHSVTKLVSVEIAKKNDNKITAKRDSLSVQEKSSADKNISLNNTPISDADVNTTLKYSVFKQGTYCDAAVNPAGLVKCTHVRNTEITANLTDTVITLITDSVDYDPAVVNPVYDTLFITVTPKNDNEPKIAVSDTINVYEGQSSKVIDLRALVSDLDGTVPVIQFTGNCAYGTAASAGTDNVIYTHSGDEPTVLNGVYDKLNFTASDTASLVNGTIVFRIINRNDSKAEGVKDLYTGALETALYTVSKENGVLKNDIEADLPQSENITSAVLFENTKHGVLDLKADGSFTYLANAKGYEPEADTFSYIITDSASYDPTAYITPVPTQVIISIANVNDETPLSAEDTIVVSEGDSTAVLKNGQASLLWNDKDLDRDSLTAILTDSTKNGIFTLNSDGTFRYKHNGTATTADSLFYTAFDGVNTGAKTRVVVEIKAKPPVADSAFYFDADADGAVDSAVVYYNHAIDPAASDFKLTWNVDSSALKTELAALGTAPNMVILTLSGSAKYRTSGVMTLTTTHKSFENAKAVHPVSDRAAPVVSSAAYKAKSKVGGELSVTLSENIVGTYTAPFMLVSGTSSTALDLGLYSSSGTTYSYAVPYSKLAVKEGDSVYISTGASVTDQAGAVQLNSGNIRQPIRIINTPISAAYLDTDMPADGRVDVISVITALPTAQTMADMIAAADTMILLNSGREFDIESIKVTAGGFAVNVRENGKKVNTAVTAEDRIIFKGTAVDGMSSFTGDTLNITDSVSPIILGGVYGIRSNSGVIDTMIALTFSEPVKDVPAAGNDHPFAFLDQSTNAPFTMSLAFDSHNAAKPEEMSFKVQDFSIDYIVSGDSVNIDKPFAVFDLSGNSQTKSVRAPIEASVDYFIDLNLLVYPQPFIIEKEESGRLQPNELAKSMRDQYRLDSYGITEETGAAFIIEATGPLAPNGKHAASARILDQTGNLVSDELRMTFVTKAGGNIAGVVVWDGKNSAGRTIGAGSYLLLVDVSVETDEGSKSRTISKQFRKTFGVNYR